MPRNGSGVYSRPAGTLAVPNTTIESSKYNSLTADFEADANAPRPVVAGGTGSSTAGGARANLGLGIGADVQGQSDNLQSIADLTLEANKGLYATGAGAVELFDLTTAGRALLAEATAEAQRNALSLGEVSSASETVTNWDNVTDSGFYKSASGATNSPVAADFVALGIRRDSNNISVIAWAADGTGPIYKRGRVNGTWGAWVEIGGGATPHATFRFDGSSPNVAEPGNRNIASITRNNTGQWQFVMSSAAPDTSYHVSVNGGMSGTVISIAVDTSQPVTTTTFTLVARDGNNARRDSNLITGQVWLL